MKATPIGMIEIGAKVYVKSVNAFGVVEDNTNGRYLVVFGSDALDEIFGIYDRNDLRCY
jgi:hypothetical protein